MSRNSSIIRTRQFSLLVNISLDRNSSILINKSTNKQPLASWCPVSMGHICDVYCNRKRRKDWLFVPGHSDVVRLKVGGGRGTFPSSELTSGQTLPVSPLRKPGWERRPRGKLIACDGTWLTILGDEVHFYWKFNLDICSSQTPFIINISFQGL